MATLHGILESMRIRRGAPNFDTNEAKILVNKEGKLVDIVLRQRGIAERMIESFMLIANETVAGALYATETAIYLPDPGRSKGRKKYRSLSIMLPVLESKSTERLVDESRSPCKKLCARSKGNPMQMSFSMMLLRSMQRSSLLRA